MTRKLFSEAKSMNWASRGVSTSLLGYSLLTAFLFGPTLVAVAQTSGTFIPTGNMTVDGPILTLLRNGKVLITGGRAGSASAELYDPSTGTFTATGSMLTAGSGLDTLLYDGREIVREGDRTLYCPSTGTS